MTKYHQQKEFYSLMEYFPLFILFFSKFLKKVKKISRIESTYSGFEIKSVLHPTFPSFM